MTKVICELLDCENYSKEECKESDILIKPLMCAIQDYIPFYYAKCSNYKRKEE